MDAVQEGLEWQEASWQEQMEELALEVLKSLGCVDPPVALEYFPKAIQRVEKTVLSRNENGSVKVSPKLILANAMDILAQKNLKIPCQEPKALAYLVDQVLSPSSWVYNLWRKKHNLESLVKAFPCFRGEQFAKRMAACLAGWSGTEIGWFQGGRLIWRQGVGNRQCGPGLTLLEEKCWRSCRDFSRYSILQDDRSEVQCWPWHRVFPKGEVILSQTQEICD